MVCPTQLPLWYTPRDCQFKVNRQTDEVLKESVLRHFPDVKFEHAMVRPNLDASLMDNAKYGIDFQSQENLDPNYADKTVRLLCEWLSPAFASKPDGCRLLPLPEAVAHVDKTAGPGFPMTLFGATKGDVLVNPECDVESCVQAFVAGETVPVCTVNPKEECRDTSKLADDNVRSFTVAPLDVNLAGIQGLYEFCECITKSWRILPATIGMNMYNGGWDSLVRRFRFPVLSTDHPKFDGTSNPRLINLVRRVMKYFSHRECWPYIDAVCDWVIDHPVLFGNGLGCWQFGGMPSGAPATIFFNTLVLWLQFIYFIVVHFEGEVSLDDIKENLDLVVHGDDAVHGVSKEWESWFTTENLNDLYGYQLRWKMNFVPYQAQPVPASEMRYLSHVTTVLRGRFVPMHESHSKILTSLVFGASSKSPPPWSMPAFRLARMAQIVNSCFPDQYLWKKLKLVEDDYIQYHSKGRANDKEWHLALAMRRDAETLAIWFTEPAHSRLETATLMTALLNGSEIVNVDPAASLNLQGGGNMAKKKKSVADVGKKVAASVKKVVTAAVKSHPVGAAAVAAASLLRGMKKTKKKKQQKTTRAGSIPFATMGNMKVRSFHAVGKDRYAGREMITSVVAPLGTNTFYKLLEINLQPSNTILWPKCNSVALDFDKWRLRSRLLFQTEATALTDAVCVLVFNPDPRVAMPASLNQAQEFDCFRFDSVRKTFSLDISRHQNMVNWYSTLPTGEVRDYCPGQIGIYVNGVDSSANGATLGYVFHEYTIEFKDAIPAQASSIEFVPVSTSGLTITLAGVNGQDVGDQVFAMGLPSTNPTMFDSVNWDHSEVFAVQTSKQYIYPVQVPMSTNNAVASTVYNATDPSVAYCGSGSVWRVGSTSTFSQQIEVAGQVGMTLTFTAANVITSIDLVVRLVLAQQNSAQEANGTVTTYVLTTNTVNISGASGTRTLALQNFYYYTVPTERVKCWFDCYIEILNSDGTTGLFTASVAPLNGTYFSVNVSAASQIQPRRMVSPQYTQFDFQSMRRLWQPLFDEGRSGYVVVYDEEKKREPLEEFDEYDDSTIAMMEQMFEKLKARRWLKAIPAPIPAPVTSEDKQNVESVDDDQKRTSSPLSHPSDALEDELFEQLAIEREKVKSRSREKRGDAYQNFSGGSTPGAQSSLKMRL